MVLQLTYDVVVTAAPIFSHRSYRVKILRRILVEKITSLGNYRGIGMLVELCLHGAGKHHAIETRRPGPLGCRNRAWHWAPDDWPFLADSVCVALRETVNHAFILRSRPVTGVPRQALGSPGPGRAATK